MVRLDELIVAKLGGATPDRVKRDCEGWDLEVLEGLGRHTGKVPVISMEAGVAKEDPSNSIDRCISVLGDFGYGLINVSAAAGNVNGVMWNAELCFALKSSRVYENASTWSGG